MKKKPPLVLFSARGRESLSEHLARRLEASASVACCLTLDVLSDDDLVTRCRGAYLVGRIRRACRDFHGGVVEHLPELFRTGLLDGVEVDLAQGRRRGGC